MSRVTISNTSPHDQTFEVHGYNSNQNIKVKAHDNTSFSAPDHVQSSGAVIAVHDGHEGEQAEITFNGYGNNTFYDISVIVGAGGNLTIQQSGKPGTIKGDHDFMQALRAHYETASAQTKAAIKDFITLDSHGEVIRMGAPKACEPLEKFVRTFANWKIYIGIGAWGNSAGDPADNFQSKGTPGGNDDLTIVYSDWTTPLSPHAVAHLAMHQAFAVHTTEAHQPVDPDTAVHAALSAIGAKPPTVSEAPEAPATNGTIKPVINGETKPIITSPESTDALATTPRNPPTNALNGEIPIPTKKSPSVSSVTPVQMADNEGHHEGHPVTPHPQSDIKRVIASKAVAPQHVGDSDKGGPGVMVSNKSSADCTYYFFPNYWNGNGTAGANFDKPSRAIHLRAHTTAFISLPDDFKGRVQRGKYIPATWVEFQIAAADGTGAHGDISLEQGYDGPAVIRALGGSRRQNGFEKDIMAGAPAGAVVTRQQDGRKVLASTMGNWLGGPNQDAIRWERAKVGQKEAYVTGGTGTDDVGSRDKRLAVDFY